MRELKQNPAAAVRAAANGDRVVITDRGKPVAQILPISSSPLADMRAAGLVKEPTRSLAELPAPPVSLRKGPSLSEIVIRRRRDERY